MKLTDEQKHDLRILKSFTHLMGFDLPERMLLRLFFALPVFMQKHDDYDLSDAACAIHLADDVMHYRTCEVIEEETK